MAMETGMQNKVALVAGGGSPIGAAAALEFAHQAAVVVVVDSDAPSGKETVAKIEAGGGEAVFVKADPAKPNDAAMMVRAAVDGFGILNYAVNVVGVAGASVMTAEYALDDWNRVIGSTLTAAWLALKHEIAQMLKQETAGAIVNVASILGTVGYPGSSAYVAAMHGILGMTRTAALEYADKGIRVNAVCPGFIQTPLMAKKPNDPLNRHLVSLHPLGRLGQPVEVARAAVWLCSDAASFVTGQAMPVDGGYNAR